MVSALGAVAVETSCGAAAAAAQAERQHAKLTFEQYIRGCVVPRAVIDGYLSGPAWARFDPELGYVQRNYVRHDAVDDSSAIYTFRPNGARTSFLYANRKPRINAYGDSFTESEQTSDGETWEEYLAGHLGEPIGNYGIGSYGVYQAYRRMIREEITDHGAEYVIFYIWGDDPIRSLMRCRYCSIYRALKQWIAEGGRDFLGARLFYGNFWAHVEMDPKTGRFIERENPLATPQSLYRMTEPQWMVDHLRNDLALQLLAYARGDTLELDRKQISRLAAALDFPFDWSLDTQTASIPPASPGRRSRTPMQVQVRALLNRYAQRANIYVLEKARAFASRNGKKLLIVVFDPYEAMQQMHNGMVRSDQETIDYLAKEKLDYFDMNEVHMQDFKKYNLSWQDYEKQYLIVDGHYNPRGNHFFAYSIKDKVIEWLNPKPITYTNPDAATLDFRPYLEGSGD